MKKDNIDKYFLYREYLLELNKCLAETLNSYGKDIENISKKMTDSLKNDHKLIFCGNGGSASISEHLSAEYVGKFIKDRKSLAAVSLTANTANITAIANDYGYEYVFSRQIEGLGCQGDVLICMSTSGRSKNVLNAIKIVKNKNIESILLSGNNYLGTVFPDFLIKVPSKTTSIIQEVHLMIGHLICLQVEKNIDG